MSSAHTPKHGELLGTNAAAKLVGVHPDTLRRYADAGRVRHYLTPGGQRRFRREDVVSLLTAVEPVGNDAA